MPARPHGVSYFADENALGLGRLLERTGRNDIVYPGHSALPEVPLGAPDLEWMEVVALHGLIVLTRDRRISQESPGLTMSWVW